VFRWRGGSGDLRGPQQLHGGEWRGEAMAPIRPGGTDPRLTGEGGAATSASKPAGRGMVFGAREALRALSAAGGGVRVLELGGGHGKERNEALVASSNRRAHGEGTREKWGGVWLGSRPRGERRRGSTWVGTDAVAPSCSDSSERCTPHRCGGSRLRTREGDACATRRGRD
jgi:hypothetical protein